ncbi:TetR/AcrR family transcriptional regulator [Nocardia uniformis]|uniref:TetR/AcrR family transcriptional regulator n=1 Tax=Nocardia uniformis TaxID=53432 RepID=A0A849C1A7_9NOCA|nr:TetR/AcrR family transcriptional regulator [Nocardia uniformis]NNH72533.1 TetR/AcrR family transcriptional regulator [Nocardia uniformis]
MPPTTGPRRRADAERSIARIIAAARKSLSVNPDASIDDIAKAAAVGRMTLYGHFPNRAELVDAALTDALRSGDETLADVDLNGNARDALTQLLDSSWSLVAESTALLIAAQATLPEERIRELHTGHAVRVEGLIRRGQREGVFRTDLPITWLVNLVHYILNGAAAEVRAGRMPADDAAHIVTTTVQSTLAPPRDHPER